MRTVLSLVSAVALLPTLTLAGPRDNGQVQHNNGQAQHINRQVQHRRVHFVTAVHWARSPYRGFYFFNGASWAVSPIGYPYAGLPLNRDYVYQGGEVYDDVYPYAIPTSNPDIVISPFALNNLVDVTGIPSGAKVRDPVSEEIFLRP
jgi:hypothetical protein